MVVCLHLTSERRVGRKFDACLDLDGPPDAVRIEELVNYFDCAARISRSASRAMRSSSEGQA
jgi:hypothetical protein